MGKDYGRPFVNCIDALDWVKNLSIPEEEGKMKEMVLSLMLSSFERKLSIEPIPNKDLWINYSCGHCGKGFDRAVTDYCPDCGFEVAKSNFQIEYRKEFLKKRNELNFKNNDTMPSFTDALNWLRSLDAPVKEKECVLRRIEYEFDRDIPVKPKFHKGRYGRKYDYYTCGNCGFGTSKSEKYCRNCGFRIADAFNGRNEEKKETV